MSDGAERSQEPMCPRCQETRQIEVMQQGWHWCGICCCPFRFPRPVEEFRGGAIIRAVPDRKG